MRYVKRKARISAGHVWCYRRWLRWCCPRFEVCLLLRCVVFFLFFLFFWEQVIDVKTKGILRAFREHKAPTRAVRWSCDGLQLASGSDDRTVRLWDLPTSTALQVLLLTVLLSSSSLLLLLPFLCLVCRTVAGRRRCPCPLLLVCPSNFVAASVAPLI